MGFGCEYMLLLQRTAKSSSLNYPGNLGRTCRRQIRPTANARTEINRDNRIRFQILFWPQSEVGSHTALLLNALLVCCQFGLCPTWSRALFHFIKSSAIDTQADNRDSCKSISSQGHLKEWLNIAMQSHEQKEPQLAVHRGPEDASPSMREGEVFINQGVMAVQRPGSGLLQLGHDSACLSMPNRG